MSNSVRMRNILEIVFAELREKSKQLNLVKRKNFTDIETSLEITIDHKREKDFIDTLDTILLLSRHRTYIIPLGGLTEYELSVFFEEVKAFVTAFSTRLPMETLSLMDVHYEGTIDLDEWLSIWSNRTEEEKNYVIRSIQQLFQGNYYEGDITALGTVGQIIAGIAGVDLPIDVLNTVYNFTNWEWTWKHLGQTVLDGVGLIPVIGVVKNLADIVAFRKVSDVPISKIDELADVGSDATTKLVNDLQGASTEGVTKLVNNADNVPIDEVADVGTEGATKLVNDLPTGKVGNVFKSQEILNEHYTKHGEEIKNAFNKSNFTISDYINEANYIIKNGTYVPEMNGYIRFVGGKGSAKYAFVGLDRATGAITTFHLKPVSELARKAPSLGFEKK